MTSFGKLVVAVFVLAILVVGAFLLLKPVPEAVVEEIPPEEPKPTEPIAIGASVEERPIEVYTFGEGDTHALFVGGIHGGYEWNSTLLAYRMIDYIEENKDSIAVNIRVSIIPSLNPDGLYEVVQTEGRFVLADVPSEANTTGIGRFNANDVDLNRNFDCKWKSESTWRGDTVSAGTEAFSEPEAATLRDYVLEEEPEAVVFWHSQANAVYASECEEGILPETLEIMNTYAEKADYTAVDVFDAYEVTGDAEGWLASIGIPAITVELSSHDDLDWERNLEATKAIISLYTK